MIVPSDKSIGKGTIVTKMSSVTADAVKSIAMVSSGGKYDVTFLILLM